MINYDSIKKIKLSLSIGPSFSRCIARLLKLCYICTLPSATKYARHFNVNIIVQNIADNSKYIEFIKHYSLIIWCERGIRRSMSEISMINAPFQLMYTSSTFISGCLGFLLTKITIFPKWKVISFNQCWRPQTTFANLDIIYLLSVFRYVSRRSPIA